MHKSYLQVILLFDEQATDPLQLDTQVQVGN